MERGKGRTTLLRLGLDFVLVALTVLLSAFILVCHGQQACVPFKVCPAPNTTRSSFLLWSVSSLSFVTCRAGLASHRIQMRCVPQWAQRIPLWRCTSPPLFPCHLFFLVARISRYPSPALRNVWNLKQALRGALLFARLLSPHVGGGYRAMTRWTQQRAGWSPCSARWCPASVGPPRSSSCARATSPPAKSPPPVSQVPPPPTTPFPATFDSQQC